ncbi:MAG: hypothetical protein HQ481_13165 [Alphaproteobacteria bacterium]|nr:hypothetical protein [Alphaproteobacteria bacterium]
MKDFTLPPVGGRADARPQAERGLIGYRLGELERRVGRLEAFVLGMLCTIALSVLGGLIAVIGLPPVG